MIAKLDARLNPESEIYSILSKQPCWWRQLLATKGVYAEIRKNDIVDVYYEGGRLAQLRCDRTGSVRAKCHRKYLPGKITAGTSDLYTDCFDILQKNPDIIIQNIRKNYSRRHGTVDEDVSEKKIQGDMITSRNPVYLDSEFAHRYETGSIRTIRFDLVGISANQLVFVELKRIKDARLRHNDDVEPEIVDQMRKYARFIDANADLLLSYYKTLYLIKRSIGLPVPACDIAQLTICRTPRLLVCNTYTSLTPDRQKRIDYINNVLGRRTKFSLTVEPHTQSYYDIQKERQDTFRRTVSTRGFSYILPPDQTGRNIFNWKNTDNVKDVITYFNDNGIKWWNCSFDKSGTNTITRHLMSSQVACINHLFFVRHDPDAVLALINGIEDKPISFRRVLNIPLDKGTDNYIAFEMISSQDYLNEQNLIRGEKCTSVDAFIYAEDISGERWLIPIEWKYTESYERDDKSTESNPICSGNERKGKKRLRRYSDLITRSDQLKTLSQYRQSIYFQEPFYQLMRQTLWAECICKSPDEKMIPAQHYMHIHICPKANEALLNKHYAEVTSQPTMEAAWREMLTNQQFYHLIDPQQLMQPLAGNPKYQELYNYLQTRYWQ